MKRKLYLYSLVVLALAIVLVYYLISKNSNTVYIVSSLPNSSPGETMEQFRGIQIALDDAKYRAGKYTVGWISLNDSDRDGWSNKIEEKNAHNAANMKNAVAYFGPLNSGAAKVSMPILNRAGLLQLSGTVTWPGLTESGFGIGEPMKYFPTGDRHFFRVVPNDAVQGKVSAVHLKNIKINNVSIIHDNTVYGRGVAMIFKKNAEGYGIKIKSVGVVPGAVADVKVVDEILNNKPEAIFIGSEVLGGIPETYTKLRVSGYDGLIIGSDLVNTSIENVIDSNDDKLYTVMPGAPLLNIKNAIVSDFYKKYIEKYKEEPSQYALYAHQSIFLILEAIKMSDGTREGVLRTFKETNGYNTAYGTTFFDENGDMIGNNASILHRVRGKWNYEESISVN